MDEGALVKVKKNKSPIEAEGLTIPTEVHHTNSGSLIPLLTVTLSQIVLFPNYEIGHCVFHLASITVGNYDSLPSHEALNLTY